VIVTVIGEVTDPISPEVNVALSKSEYVVASALVVVVIVRIGVIGSKEKIAGADVMPSELVNE
jgi:hypothetical protein